jgi:hypothetical protein
MHPLVPVGLLLLVVQLWCWVQAARRIEYVAGHRAGAKGYTGARCASSVVWTRSTAHAGQHIVFSTVWVATQAASGVKRGAGQAQQQ